MAITFKDFGVVNGSAPLTGCVSDMNAWLAENPVQVISIETLQTTMRTDISHQNHGAIRLWYKP